MRRRERAAQVAKELGKDKIYLTEMMKRFNISYPTAKIVYEIQGFEPYSVSERRHYGQRVMPTVNKTITNAWR